MLLTDVLIPMVSVVVVVRRWKSNSGARREIKGLSNFTWERLENIGNSDKLNDERGLFKKDGDGALRVGAMALPIPPTLCPSPRPTSSTATPVAKATQMRR